MKFKPSKINGVFLIELERREDERGWFARTWCTSEFAAHGIMPEFSQCSASFNHKRGTLRGMHYQAAPFAEEKLVRCTRGAAYDVVLDLRPDSSTYLEWTAAEITEENGLGLYIPKGCAHGFQTLLDATEIFYTISTPYRAGGERGVRWNDPLFSITWPQADAPVINPRDMNYPDYCTAPP